MLQLTPPEADIADFMIGTRSTNDENLNRSNLQHRAEVIVTLPSVCHPSSM